jgi:hypothetical protein
MHCERCTAQRELPQQAGYRNWRDVDQYVAARWQDLWARSKPDKTLYRPVYLRGGLMGPLHHSNGTGVPVVVFDRLPMVAVQLAHIQATFYLYRAGLMMATSMRLWRQLCDCSGACSWTASLVAWKPRPCGASMQLKARWFWIEVLGEILVKSPDTDAFLPSGATIPFWRASWLPFVHFSLCEGKP